VRVEADRLAEYENANRTLSTIEHVKHERMIVRLSKELRAAQCVVDQQNEQLRQLQAGSAQIAGRIDAIAEEIEAKRTARAKQSSEADRRGREAELADEQGRLREAEATLNAVIEQKARLERVMADGDGKVVTLLEELDALRAAQRKQEIEMAEIEGSLSGAGQDPVEAKAAVDAAATAVADASAKLEQAKDTLRDVAERIDAARSDAEALNEARTEAQEKVDQARNDQKDAEDELGEKHREHAEMLNQARALRIAADTAKKKFDRGIFADKRPGYDFVHGPNRPPGLHGLVFEKIRVPDDVLLAVTAVAKQKLMQVIAETQADVNRAVSEMARLRRGRMTFMPLDRLEPVPRVENSLADLVECESRFRPVVDALFAKVALVDNLATVPRGTSCVTRDGDLQDRSGAVTGGSRVREGMLHLHLRHVRAMEACADADREIQRLLDEEVQATLRLKDATKAYRAGAEEMRKLDAKLGEARIALKGLERLIESNEAAVERCEFALGAAQANEGRARAFLTSLTTTVDVRALRKRNDVIVRDVVKRRKAISDKEKQLMRQRSSKESAERDLEYIDIVRAESAVAERRGEVARRSSVVRQLGDAGRELDGSLERLGAEMSQLEARMRLLRGEYQTARDAEDQQRVVYEQAFHAAHVIRQRMTPPPEGTSDPEIGERVRRLTDAQIDKMQAETLRWQNDVRDVNIHAHAQLALSEEGIARHEAELALLARSHISIASLVDKTETDREESIAVCFRKVNAAFVDVLKELEPEAIGGMLLSGRSVSLNVGFNGQRYTPPAQLSGGQKALLSLTLILAIQRVLPAPFYLFDEVDAALDEKYRVNLAGLLQRYTRGDGTRSPAQVILTTFKPELLVRADQVFEVRADEGHSLARATTIEAALRLLAVMPERPAAPPREPSEVEIPDDIDDIPEGT
jgi:chromosome segregation ATPase